MDGRTQPKVGGWLFFFAITLIVIGPLVKLIGIVLTYQPVASIMPSYPKFATMYVASAVMDLVLIAASIFAGISILQVRPYALRVTRMFLFLSPLIMFVCVIAYSSADLPAKASDAMNRAGAMQVSRMLIYAIVWGLYLKFSKRVRETFPNRGGKTQGASLSKAA
ncbi:MAG TPA: DUF2569 family protein [Candidatus Polarisedimenticolia bacterium]|nr:DUF2569 family protein [Candidatus Polarisedimenticolia bacterium]